MIFRKAIILIHGFGGCPSDVEYLARHLQVNKRFDVYTFTLPGHEDRSRIKSKNSDWIKRCEEEVEWLIKHNYKKIYVIGHSMGGVLATHLANKYREIKKLVLLAPAFKYFEFEGDSLKLLKSIQKSPEILKGYSKKTVFSRFLSIPISTLTNFINLVKEHYDDPKNIDIPTLIIHGTEDKVAPVASSIYVYENSKSKINVLVKIGGVNHHLLQSERKDEVCVLINDFLKFNLHIRCKKTIDI